MVSVPSKIRRRVLFDTAVSHQRAITMVWPHFTSIVLYTGVDVEQYF